jgi:hypothetical protein
VFHDVISKDKNKLEKMIDDLLQESKFSELAGEIKELFHQYLTDGELIKKHVSYHPYYVILCKMC